MSSRYLSASAIAMVSLTLVARTPVAADELPPGPVFTMQSKFEATTPSAPFELVQMVLDFPPGNWTPRHTHGGPVFVTVLAGEVAVRDDNAEQTFRTGDTWMETPGEHHAAGNTSGENARVLVSVLLPQGADLTTVDQAGGTSGLPPGPTLVYQTRTGSVPAGAVEVVQLKAEFAPGTWTPRHEHGGRGAVTVLEGRLTVRDDAGERSFGPGESWIEGVGEIAAVGNPDAASGSLVATFVVPRGVALTTVREASDQLPSAMPRTGGGGVAGHSIPGWISLVVALVAGLLLAGRRGRQIGQSSP